MTQQVSNAISGVLGGRDGEPRSPRRKPVGPARTVCAIARLAKACGRLEHVPTVQQLRAMAWLDGCEPCSYLLDPARNYVPELPVGGKDPVGTYALCFTGRRRDGLRSELVALPNGWAFDLNGPFALSA